MEQNIWHNKLVLSPSLHSCLSSTSLLRCIHQYLLGPDKYSNYNSHFTEKKDPIHKQKVDLISQRTKADDGSTFLCVVLSYTCLVYLIFVFVCLCQRWLHDALRQFLLEAGGKYVLFTVYYTEEMFDERVFHKQSRIKITSLQNGLKSCFCCPWRRRRSRKVFVVIPRMFCVWKKCDFEKCMN